MNAILNCYLVTGRIGKAGTGPIPLTGQPNAMVGREVGGLANILANHLDLENAAHGDAVREFWQSPTICTKPGLKAVDLFQACADGRIKALWVISTNPAVSLPDADSVAAAIAKVPVVVTSDIMEKTDTNDLADVLLPATGWSEKDGTVTNSERCISRQRASLLAPAPHARTGKLSAMLPRAWGLQTLSRINPLPMFSRNSWRLMPQPRSFPAPLI
ncbi:molybdopterin-dependent oxidoreductase [Sulfitobacter sp.]|uniref:molybdopterin-dependent oxidoreductase n=1 Tax=Sulfitobacter sp. TaxID=1903071 RepID=UPI003001F5D6